MKLVNGETVTLQSGDYQLTYRIGTGSASLVQSVEGEAYTDIVGSAQTTSTQAILTVGVCMIQAVLTGDATATLTRITY